MKEGYYAPSIEEFHPGFEYEWKDYLRDGSGNWKWVSEILKNSPTVFKRILDIYFKGDQDKEFRVKRLSRECIEAEGWNKSLNDDRMCYKDVVFRGDKKIARILQTAPIHQHVLIYLSGLDQKYTEGDTIFSGTIRNKSELKRVLKQVMPITLKQTS